MIPVSGTFVLFLRHGERAPLPPDDPYADVDLTAREFDLLFFFARHPGKVFSRMDLLTQVWGYSHEGYEHTVNTHINRLRGKIEADPARPELIRTVWGVGYKFTPEPSRAEEGEVP